MHSCTPVPTLHAHEQLCMNACPGSGRDLKAVELPAHTGPTCKRCISANHSARTSHIPQPHHPRELKAVELRTLNRERADMVIEGWLTTGKVPCAAEVREELGQWGDGGLSAWLCVCWSHGSCPHAWCPTRRLFVSFTQNSANCILLGPSPNSCPLSLTRHVSHSFAPPSQISARERLLLPPDEDCHSLAAAIVPLRDMLQSPSQLSRMQQQYKDSQYMLTVQQPRGGGGLFASLPLPGIFGEGLAPKPRIAIALRYAAHVHAVFATHMLVSE